MSNKISAPADVAAPPKEAVRTESGLCYVMLKSNPEGAEIGEDDWVKLHYTGWTTDGEMFDSSRDGEPAVFPINQLIPGMCQALQIGRVGESLRVWIPEELAYKGVQGAPQGMLVFDFEILEKSTPETPSFEPLPGAVELHDGLYYLITKRGSGSEEIREGEIVSIDFTGWHVDSSTLFQSSRQLGEPLIGQVKDMFPGFREVLVHAHEGDSLTIWVPQALGVDPIGRRLRGRLVFTVDIHEVRPEPRAIPAPEDVAAPPADAEKTASGLATKVLSAGNGEQHPTATSRVRVHYTGWTTDGVMFDSSVIRGEPVDFGLNQVIPGWTEGVQLMVEGEKRRLWIPEALAYKGMRGAPQGMLVFDVELIAII